MQFNPCLVTRRLFPSNRCQSSVNHNNLHCNLVKIKCHGKRNLDVHYWNAQSLGNKTTTINDYLLEKDIDLLVITETWLAEEDPVIIGECTPSGYSFLNFSRPGDRHGGIAIISKSCIKVTLSPVGMDTISFEHASVTDSSKSFRLIAIYRPPPSVVNGFTHIQFNEELNDFLSALSTLPGKPIIMGDMNVHVNKPSKLDVSRYLGTLAEHDLKQYVNRPTHICGNILDHIICRPEDGLLRSHASCVVSPFRYGSDHHMIECRLTKSKPSPDRRVFTSRSFKDLNMNLLNSDLTKATQCILSSDDPDVQAELYNISIRKVLDKHCPEKTRSQKLVRNPKWYTDDVRDARRNRRKSERRWRKTRLNLDRVKFIELNDTVNTLIIDRKTIYFRDTLENANAKTMYKTLNSLLNSSVQKLPSCDSSLVLSNTIA
jgi:hypothetical protein